MRKLLHRVAWNAGAIGFLVAAGLLGSAGQLSAEVFVLKSGGRIEAEQLNPGRQRGEAFQVRTEEGVRMALAEANVQRVIAKTDLDKEYEERLPTVKNTVESQWAMAEWCLEAELNEQRVKHLQAVIALAPDHEEARKALGYRRYGSRWLTPEQHMESLGYARYKGAWRLKQEIEIESREVQLELLEKKLRKDIRTWFDQLAGGGRYADVAEQKLAAINEPAAASSLAEILGDRNQPRASRLMALSILTRVAPGSANATLIRLAMEGVDPEVCDACLAELKRQGPQASAPAFVLELKSKDNKRVNRAAECLDRIGAKEATLHLINALVTEHRFVVQQGGPPGSMTTTFGNSSGGLGSGSPGGGGMAMGGKPQVIKRQLKNGDVLAALATMHPDVNFQYDVEAWRNWYIQTYTTSQVDLRRGD